MKKIFAILAIVLTCFVVSANYVQPAFAADPYEKITTPKPQFLPGPTETTQANSENAKQYFLNTVMGRVTQTLIAFTAVTCFILIVYAGLQLIMQFGNEERISTAKRLITWSIVGLLVSMLSYAIVSIIIRTLPAQETSYDSSTPFTEEGKTTPGETDLNNNQIAS